MCRSDENEHVRYPSISGMRRLTTIAALLDVPVERFFEDAEAAARNDEDASSYSSQEQLAALYRSLDQLNRSVALSMMRRLAAKRPKP